MIIIKRWEPFLFFFIVFFLLQKNCFGQQWGIRNPLQQSNKMLVANGGIYVAGSHEYEPGFYQTKATIVKYDYQGKRILHSTFYDSVYWHTAQVKSIDSIPNTGDIIVLATATLGASNTFILARIDRFGNIIWKTTFSKSDFDNPVLVDATSLPGKIVTLTANVNDSLEYNLWDTLGKNILHKPFDLNIDNIGFYSKGLFKCNDGYFVLAGGSCGILPTISKVDYSGNILFNKNYDWIQKMTAFVLGLPDGTFEVYYATKTFIQYDVFTAEGDMIKSDTIKIPAITIEDIQTTPDKGLLLCGSMQKTAFPDQGFAFAAKVDSNYANIELYENEKAEFENIFQLNNIGQAWVVLSKRIYENSYLYVDTVLFQPYVSRLGVSDLMHGASLPLILYPNPAKSNITIQFQQGNKSNNVSIFDMTGKLKYNVNNIQQEYLDINIDDYTQGMYSVVCINEDGLLYSTKLIKK